MAKPNHKVKKIICPRCKGNGYIKIPHESVDNLEKSVIAQCTMCESEGEIDEKIWARDYTPIIPDELQPTRKED